jgi:hypothetical protein
MRTRIFRVFSELDEVRLWLRRGFAKNSSKREGDLTPGPLPEREGGARDFQ